MKKTITLEEMVKKYLDKNKTLGRADTYDTYKHKKSLPGASSYQNAVGDIYASSKKSLASYGHNNRLINNKGLQNSGYSAYIDSLAKNSFISKLGDARAKYGAAEDKALSSYASYLDAHKRRTESVKRSVMSHLVSNDVVDLGTAVAYGISAGLSKEDAALVGQSAYEVTRQKVLNSLIEQSVKLGLDKEGSKMLALKMGVSEEDANAFADEIDEMMKHYRSISEEYLEYLKSKQD